MSNLPILAGDNNEPRIVDRHTGETIAIHDATLEQLAGCRDWIRDFEDTARAAKRLIDAEVIGRLDANARWTVEAGPYKLSAPSPAPETRVDAQELRGRLEELVADGVLSIAAVDAAVEVVTEFKAKAAGVKALVKLGGLVAEVVGECSSEVPRDRRVSIRRAAA